MDIIDVTDFTQTLQKSVTENLAPEFKAIKTDIVKKFQESILEGKYDIAIETVGDDKVKSLNQNLAGSSTYFTQIKHLSEQLKVDLSSHVSKSDQLAEIGKQRTDITNGIAERQADLKKVVEQTIPGVQLQLEKEKEALLLLNVKDSAYDSQKDKVKQLEDTLVQANTTVADYIGQIEAATHFRDNELETMEQIANTTGVSSDRSAKLNEHLHKQVKLSDDNLKKNQELLEILEKQGEAKKKLVEQAQPILEEYEGMLDNISQGISGFFGKFPLVGGLLSAHLKKPLEEATDIAKKSLRKAFLDAASAADQGAGSLGAMAAGTKSLVSGIAGIGKAMIGALLNPFSIVLLVVGGLIMLFTSALKELSKLENAGRDFRKELGMSAEQTAGIRSQTESLYKQYKGIGIELEKWYEATSALADVNASVDHSTKQQVEFVGLLEKATGVQASTTAGAMANIMKLGATGRGQAEAMVGEIRSLAQKHGVAFAKVMEDVASASEEALIFAGGSAKALAQGAIHARRLGSSLEDVASSAESLLDFEGSINSEMQASTMFGRHINMNALRAAALAGDANAMLEERHRIMDSLGGLENMSRWQQKALADAMGTSVGELMNMNKAREQEQMLQTAANAKEEWAIDALRRRNAEKAKENMSEIEKLKLMELENRKAESIEALQTRIKDVMYQISTALLPLAKEILPKIEEFFQSFIKPAEKGSEHMYELSDRGNSLKDTLLGIGSTIGSIGEAVGSVLKLFTITDNWVVNLGIAAGILVGMKVTFGIISGLAGSITSKLLGGGGSGGGGRGGILGSIKNFLNGIKPQNILAVSAAILVLSGALFVTAKAFQEFAKVNWKNAWPGFIAMGALVLMAKSLSSASASMLIGAAAIAALGVALIPATYAFQMFGNVSWSDVIAGAVALGVLALAAFKLGAVLASGVGAIAFTLGVTGIAALGAAAIPLAYALKLAGPALSDFGKILADVASVIGGAVVSIVNGIVSIAEIIGNTLVNIMGAAATSFAIFTGSLISLSSIGIDGLLGIAGGITAIAVAMAGLGVGSAVGGVTNAVGAMGNKVAGLFGADTEELNKSPLQKILDFAKESKNITLVADKIDFLLNSFERLAGMEDILESAGSALQTFGESLSSFGMGQATSGIGNAVGAIGNKVAGMFGAEIPTDPIEQLLGFIDKLGSVDLNLESLDLLSNLNLNGFLGNITDDFEDKIEIVSEGLINLFEAFNSIKPSAIAQIDRASDGVNRLLFGLTQQLPKVKTSDSRTLAKVADALEDFFESVDDLNASKVSALPMVGTGISSLITGIENISTIPETTAESLSSLGEGIGDFFGNLDDISLSSVEKLTTVGEYLNPFISKFATLPFSSIPAGVGDILSNIGDGIEDFSDNLGDVNQEALGQLPSISKLFLPFLSEVTKIEFSKLPKDASHIDNSLSQMGEGIHDFFDNLSGVKMGAVGQLSAIQTALVPFLSGVSDFQKINDVSSFLTTETANKIKDFGLKFVDAMNSFSGIQDPAVQALSAITDELYRLCSVIETLDVNKLDGLENINIGGVQTEIKIPPRDPFLEGTITEGTLPPKLMMTESPSLAEAFAVESKPKVIEETMTKRAKEREDTFRQQYETADEITKRIEHDLKFLEEEKAKYANDEVGMRSIQGGIKLVMEDVAVLEKLRSELKSEQPVVDAITPTTNTQESSLQNFFAEPPTEVQVQQTLETGTMSLAEAFESQPPELITEQKPEISILKNEKIKDAKKVNEMVQPIVDVVGSIYTKFIPESIKQKFSDFAKNEYFNLDEDHSMEAYKRSLGVNDSVTNNILGDMGVMSAGDTSTLNTSGDKVNENQFTSSTQFEQVAQSTGLLDQIMAGILRKELPTKLYAEGQLVGLNTDSNIRMYEDQDGFTQVDESMKVSVNDISPQLAKNVGARIKMLDEAIINNTTLENDSLNKLLESRRQQLTDEGRLLVNEIQSQVGPQINPEVDVLDSTSTKPIVQRLQIAENQPQFKLDVTEPINEQIQESEINPASSIFTKISDFAKNILPDFDFFDSQTDADESSLANIELSGIDTISVKGQNVFVEEIAKIVNTGSTGTTDTDKKEIDGKVVKKLDELILLMRQGGISVNMDGRKVSKAVAGREY